MVRDIDDTTCIRYARTSISIATFFIHIYGCFMNKPSNVSFVNFIRCIHEKFVKR